MSKEKKDSSNEHHHHNGEATPSIANDRLDPAGKALAEALRRMFFVLKLVMIGAVGLFVWSGFYRVSQNQRAVVLRFGQIKGAGIEAIKEPGLHWSWPYPIDEVVRIPASSAVREVDIETFWYYQSEKEKAGLSQPRLTPNLQFTRDGYNLTASRSAAKMALRETPSSTDSVSGVEAPIADYNLIHTKWRLRYSVSDPFLFFEQVWNGLEGSDRQNGWYEVDKLLHNVVADAIVVISASRDIDWILFKEPLKFSEDVQRRVVERLGLLNVGLAVTDLDLIDKTPPRQVLEAFNRATSARTERNQLVAKAQGQASEIINTAKSDAEVLVADAQGYRKTVAQAAKGDAEYLEEVLNKIDNAASEAVPESSVDYQAKRQKVYNDLLAQTVDQLYQEMLRDVMENAEETFVLNSAKNGMVEWRPYFSRDATISKKKTVEEK